MEDMNICKTCSKSLASNEYSFDDVCQECLMESGECLTTECDVCQRVYPVQNGELMYDGLYCETCDTRLCGDCNVRGGVHNYKKNTKILHHLSVDSVDKFVCEKCPRVICRECNVSGLCETCDNLYPKHRFRRVFY